MSPEYPHARPNTAYGSGATATALAENDKRKHARKRRRIPFHSERFAAFWAKLDEDWVFNFSGMLAYNYLTAIAPILLGLLTVGGLVISAFAPATYNTFVVGIAQRIPDGQGQALVHAAADELRKEAGIVLAIAIVTAVYSGSRLFVTLESVFAIIYRVDERPFLRQNAIAIVMMLLFLMLAPLSFFAGGMPALLLSFSLPPILRHTGLALTIEGFIGSIVAAFIMFIAMYAIIPNRKRNAMTIWPGALIAAISLNLYEALFPLYQSLFLTDATSGYGSVAGLAVVVLAFLYYVGFITLLGAEINAWIAGMRPLGATLPQLFRHTDRARGASSDNPR